MDEILCEKMNRIENKIDSIQKEMEEIWGLLNSIKSDLSEALKKSDCKNAPKRTDKIIVVDDRTKWKKEIYGQIKVITSKENSFKKRSEVLRYLYNYMRRNYGIVWEQDIKEYKERFDIEYKPRVIDVIYYNKIYKSIFEAVLIDMAANIQTQSNSENHMLV